MLTFSTQSSSTFSNKVENLEKVQQRATGINKINPAQKVANHSRTLQHGKAEEHEKCL